MIKLSNLKKAIMDEDNITLKEMEQIFNVTTEELFSAIKNLLHDAKGDEILFNRIIERGDIIYGKLHINRENNGIVNFGSYKFHINSNDIKDALDEDMVLLELIDKDKKKAKVKHVIERNNGLLTVNYIDGKFTPLFEPFSNNIILSDEDMAEVELNDRLLLKIDRTEGDNTYCHIQTKIGKKDDLALEEKTIAAKNGFPLTFSSLAQKEEEELPDRVLPKDFIGRVDLRGEKSFTIDDEKTQDIDDGLFIKTLPNRNTLVGVPISLISAYVSIHSAIFNDALERDTSVYLGEHSDPMFCRKLCNGIGSLNPNEDRLARTHLIEFDKDYNIVNYKNVQSVIRSRKKMNYHDVNNIITRDIVKDDYIPYVDALRKLYEITLHLERRKLLRGACNFKSQDVGIVFDNRMQAIGFHPLDNIEARKIIEHFAILVNELADEYAAANGFRNINRVELAPDPEKFNQVIRMINASGKYNIKEIENIQNPREVAKVINAIKNDPRYDAYSSQLLRAMPKAFYSTSDLGHYGLALNSYAQCTSPIRRIGDFINNKQFDYIDAGVLDELSFSELTEIAKKASQMEIKADKATQEANKMYMAQYMSSHLGEEFNGMIMDINPSGLLIKSDNQVLGKVNIDSIQTGKYRFNRGLGALVGKQDDDRYCIGDKVKVLVKGANVHKRTVDFEITDRMVA